MNIKEIYLAGGCFWGVEKYLGLLSGVEETEVGYANGNTENPSYEEVCRCGAGHAETVRVKYDADKIDLPSLLERFYEIIDPTSLNRQGGDVGTQYRTGIYFSDGDDLPAIKRSLDKLQERHNSDLAIEVMELENYYPAETYHQKYLSKNPGGYCHISSAQFAEAKRTRQRQFRKQTDAELKTRLTEMQYKVTQKNATEPPFQNEYSDKFAKGIYIDITTGEPLFSSAAKFDSGCGWPAFSKPIDDSLLIEKNDLTMGVRRTEVRSKTGDAHMGHVFPDGPVEMGGLRYCINSAALRFIPAEDMEKEGYGEYKSLID